MHERFTLEVSEVLKLRPTVRATPDTHLQTRTVRHKQTPQPDTLADSTRFKTFERKKKKGAGAVQTRGVHEDRTRHLALL